MRRVGNWITIRIVHVQFFEVYLEGFYMGKVMGKVMGFLL